ncbi:MAG TPA: hypothetical protein VJN71_01800 [Nitrososphaerales archaeon]|nr:hypothetical protein [Nitrososphaerales archaeon]
MLSKTNEGIGRIIAILSIVVAVIIVLGVSSSLGVLRSPSHSTTDMSCTQNTSQEENITWDLANRSVLAGEVTCLGQLHNLTVYLTLRNGTKWSATEPAIDDVFALQRECGSLCSGMYIWTE